MAFTQEAIFAGNPLTKRAMRVKWSLKPNESIVAFGSQKNLIIKDLENPLASKIFNNQVLNNVTAVKYSNNGNYLAFGDEKGNIKIIGWS